MANEHLNQEVAGRVLFGTDTTSGETRALETTPEGRLRVVVDADDSQIGASVHQDNSADEAVAEVKDGPGVLLSINVENGNAAEKNYIQFFDVATGTTVTPGTTVPDFVIPLGATGVSRITFAKGIAFANGLKYIVATTPTGGTGPTADAILTLEFI